MKKWLLIISATVICVAAAFLYFFSLTPKGDTITSRESILNTAISKGNESDYCKRTGTWRLYREWSISCR